MILHFVTDEKFTDYTVAQFSAPEMCSDIVCLNTSDDMDLVASRESIKVMCPYTREFVSFLDENLSKYAAIVLHGMHWGPWQNVILQKAPKNVKVAWYFWGGEIYGRHDCNIPRFAPMTKIVMWIRGLSKGSKKGIDTSWELPYDSYQRVDYCLTGEAEEYEYAKEFLNHERMQFIWYTCYDIDAMLGALKDASCNGNNVIVGNSATDTCNYFDVLPRLRGVLQPNQKVVLPLSYGAQWISNIVSKYANIVIGKHAMPLLDYMPREEYNKILQSCSVMIMDQYIPQAQGNILTGLWLGMRVYMSEKSIAFKFFKRIGFKIFSFESEFKKYRLTSLPQEDVTENRRLMVEWYSKEHVMQSAKNVVDILEGK